MDASLSVISTVTVIVTRIAISLSLLRAGALKVPGLEPPGIDQFGCIVTVPHPGDLHRPVRGVSLVQCRDEFGACFSERALLEHFPVPFRGNPSRSGSGAAKETTDLGRVRKDTSTSVRLSASPWWTQRLWEG